MLYKVVLTIESDHSSESYIHVAVLSYDAVYYAAQGGYNFGVCG